jgi:hypothetical protein
MIAIPVGAVRLVATTAGSAALLGLGLGELELPPGDGFCGWRPCPLPGSFPSPEKDGFGVQLGSPDAALVPHAVSSTAAAARTHAARVRAARDAGMLAVCLGFL